MPYLTLGDPSLEKSLEFSDVLLSAGADILELGIPFSDPIADGPLIQDAMQRAFNSFDKKIVSKKEPLSIKNIFSVVKKIHLKHPDVPLLFLCYANSILGFSKGKTTEEKAIEKFLTNCKDSSIKALVIPDLPFDTPEYEILSRLALKYDVATVLLVSPTTSEDRLEKICQLSQGWIYCVTSLGVTGIRKELPSDLSRRFLEIKKKTKVPIFAGFGIKEPSQVNSLKGLASGFIVGSKNHEIISQYGKNAAQYLKKIALSFVKETLKKT